MVSFRLKYSNNDHIYGVWCNGAVTIVTCYTVGRHLLWYRNNETLEWNLIF